MHSRLCADLLAVVGSKLDWTCLRRASAACRAWRSALQSNLQYKLRSEREYGADADGKEAYFRLSVGAGRYLPGAEAYFAPEYLFLCCTKRGALEYADYFASKLDGGSSAESWAAVGEFASLAFLSRLLKSWREDAPALPFLLDGAIDRTWDSVAALGIILDKMRPSDRTTMAALRAGLSGRHKEAEFIRSQTKTKKKGGLEALFHLPSSPF